MSTFLLCLSHVFTPIFTSRLFPTSTNALPFSTRLLSYFVFSTPNLFFLTAPLSVAFPSFYPLAPPTPPPPPTPSSKNEALGRNGASDSALCQLRCRRRVNIRKKRGRRRRADRPRGLHHHWHLTVPVKMRRRRCAVVQEICPWHQCLDISLRSRSRHHFGQPMHKT